MQKPKINGNRMRIFIHVAIISCLIFTFPKKSDAQLAFVAGGNYSNIRSEITLENKNPVIGYNIGFSLQYYPFKNHQKFSIVNEPGFVQKGYQQEFQETYSFRFTYFALPVLMNYEVTEQFSAQAGFEISTMISTDIEHGLQTYNNFDLGFVIGANFFGNSRINCFTRLTYGLLPMLDYYEIDELGNFNSEIHDLKNMCISLGFKLKLYNEKIRFYK